MAQRPGVFSRMIGLFFNSVKPRYDRTVMGRDQFNNIYYEEKNLQTESMKSVKRGYIPGDRVNWNNVPPEWESWLKCLRQVPPTQEEIDANYEHSQLVKRRAGELDEKARQERLAATEKDEAEVAALTSKTLKVPEVRSYDAAAAVSERPGFPSHEGLENNPGEKYRQEQEQEDQQRNQGGKQA